MDKISPGLVLTAYFLRLILIVSLPFIGFMLIISEPLRGWSIATGVVCLMVWRELFQTLKK